MARLNIEDEFFLAVMGLVSPTVDVDKAHGNTLRFIRFAQEKFRTGRIITDLEFDRLGFLPGLVGLFAEKVDGGYAAIGASKFFDWLLDKPESGQIGGRISAQRPRDVKGRLLPRLIQATSKHYPSNVQATPSSPSTVQASPSPSPSPYISNSLEEEECTDLILKSVPTESVRQTVKIQTVDELRGVISKDAMNAFVKLYSVEYVDREFEKAVLWLTANPKKTNKTRRGWQMFIANWLDRGWAKHVTQLPSTPATKSRETAESIAERLIRQHDERHGA